MTRDMLAPAYKIVVAGTTLREDVTKHVLSLEYEEGADLAPEASITVANPDMRFLDSKVLAEGNPVELWIGYGKKLVNVGRVELARHQPVFPESGIPTLAVKGYGAVRKLMEKRAGGDGGATVHTGQTDSDIARRMAQAHGLAVDIADTSEVLDRVQRADLTDYQFLRRLAALHGFEFAVRYDPDRGTDVLGFGPRKTAAGASYRFEYGAGDRTTLLSFEPELSTSNQATEVEVLAWDRTGKRAVAVRVASESKAEDPNFRGTQTDFQDETSSGGAVTFAAQGQVLEVVADRPFENEDAARTFAQAWLAELEQGFLTARGRVIGVETLRPGQVHELAGIGTRLSGRWRFTRVRHALRGDAAYVVDFSAVKVPANGRLL